jgi:hypothetical protein
MVKYTVLEPDYFELRRVSKENDSPVLLPGMVILPEELLTKHAGILSDPDGVELMNEIFHNAWYLG